MTIEVFGRVAVIALPGELQRHADHDLARTIEYAVACGHQHLVLDFTPATSLDDRSFGVLVRTLPHLELHPRGAVVVAGARGEVGRLLDGLAGDLMFTSFASRADALRALRDPSRRMHDGWRTATPPELPARPDAVPTSEARVGSWLM